MYKQVKIKNLFYEMLLEVSKKQRKKPEEGPALRQVAGAKLPAESRQRNAIFLPTWAGGKE